MGSIYLIVNESSKKCYVGMTMKTIQERFDEHLRAAKNGSQYPIHRALRKHDLNNFDIIWLEDCDVPDDLADREIWWIDQLETFGGGYNATRGGEGVLGLKHTQETRERISASLRGKKLSKKHRRAISKSIRKSEKFSASCFARRGIKNRHQAVPVEQLDLLTGERIRSHESISDAVKDVPFTTAPGIIGVCRGRTGQHAGFRWCYVDRPEVDGGCSYRSYKHAPKRCNECGQDVGKLGTHLERKHHMTLSNYLLKHDHRGIRPTCECGCGAQTEFDPRRGGRWLRFVSGHQNVGRTKTEEQRKKISETTRLAMEKIKKANDINYLVEQRPVIAP